MNAYLPPDWEAFESLLQAHGYFKDGTPKTQAARDIAMLIVPNATLLQRHRRGNVITGVRLFS